MNIHSVKQGCTSQRMTERNFYNLFRLSQFTAKEMLKVKEPIEKKHVKTKDFFFETLIPLCGLGQVRKINFIPLAWTPSIFCLRSIFMNPQGFLRIKHINNLLCRWAKVCTGLTKPRLLQLEQIGLNWNCFIHDSTLHCVEKSTIMGLARDAEMEFGSCLTVRKCVYIQKEQTENIFFVIEVNDARKGLKSCYRGIPLLCLILCTPVCL